jgi:Ser/Thr protein kinase RdoA (MazF antagonist)
LTELIRRGLAGVHPTVGPAWDNWALSAEQRTLVLECRDALRERLGRWGKDRERYGIIHSDLMPENLLVAADGVRLNDFDDAGFGWYLYDPAPAVGRRSSPSCRRSSCCAASTPSAGFTCGATPRGPRHSSSRS